MIRHAKSRRLVVALLALWGLAGASAWVAGQVASPPAAPAAAAAEPLRLTRDEPGDSKPVVLHADAITAWVEGSTHVFLLQGQVLVEQGIVQARFGQGIVRVDTARLQRTHILRAEVYAEGDVRLENGSDVRDGARAILELNTRGALNLHAAKSKVVQQSRASDPLCRRAVEALAPPAPPSPIQRTSLQEPSPPPPPPAPTFPSPGQPAPGPRITPPAPPGPVPGIAPGAGPPALVVPPPPPVPGPSSGLPPSGMPGPPGRPGPPAAASDTLPPPRPVPGTAAPGPPPPSGPPRNFSIAPRTAQPPLTQIVNLPGGDQALVVTGGVILNIQNVDKVGMLDIAADKLVIWTKGGSQQLLNSLSRPEGATGKELEVYMAGHVELHERVEPPPVNVAPTAGTTSPPKAPEERTLRADEVYYDVRRNVALATSADLEIKREGLIEPLHFRGVEVRQLSPTQFQTISGQLHASRLPSDPGLTVSMGTATLEEKEVIKRGLFSPVVSRTTGQPVKQEQDIVTSESTTFAVEGVPFFYLPYARFDARDPLGPLQNISIGYNSVFGFQLGLTFNLYDLIGIDPRPGSRWTLNTDYLSSRGPALGTDYEEASNDLFGIPAKNALQIKAWGIEDSGKDILGGGRGELDHHPDWRGRFLYRQNVQDLPDGFSVQAQLSALSDHNFLEQYYKSEFDNDINQETFLFVKQQQGNWAWTVLGEPRIRNWVTETQWLPRADGYLIGESLFNRFTYSAWASAGYASLETVHNPPTPVVDVTDRSVSTGRFDLSQELGLPFYAGPVKVVPYGILDLTYYTDDLDHTDVGRTYGGGGVRASIPFSRLYPEIQSEWFNLNGIYHKVALTGNYYYAQTSVPFTKLPQLDRLNDDASDQALRDIKPLEPILNPGNGVALATSPVFDPQLYAIRRLVEDRIDTRGDIDVFQADLYQRWQTKRGYPGQQHIIDWMTLDLSASLYPESKRDDFGHPLGFIDYDWLWHVGDRNGFVSNGWFEPFPGGARVFNIGGFYEREDKTNLYLGYRQIDPVDSRLVTASITAVLSPKYAFTASTSYDFGTSQSQANSLVLTRMGSDLQLSIGITYNAITNNFGVLFEIVPNVVAETRKSGGPTALGAGGGGLLGGR